MSEIKLALPRIHSWYTNINAFPFPLLTLVMSRVRTDLPLADLHCQGTLALSVEQILTVLSSYYCQDSHYWKVHFSSRKNFCPISTPAYRSPCGRQMYRWLFSPVHFQHSLPRRVSCYALFKGWLLLSQPPLCFRWWTTFTLSHLTNSLGP